jgi:cell division initiation protein
MKLTPLEVQQKTFKKTRFGGADAREVDEYLDLVGHEMEELIRELHRLQETLRQKDAQLAEHKEREALLQSTLTTAQRLSEDLKSHARKEAELVLSDAELQAEKIIANAQARRLSLIGEIDELKRSKATFASQLGSMIEAHRAMLEAMSGEANKGAPSGSGDNLSFLAPPSKR